MRSTRVATSTRVSATVVGGCRLPHMKSPARFIIIVALCVTAFSATGCSEGFSGVRAFFDSEARDEATGTAEAQAVLGRFFAAWAEEDAGLLESYLDPRRRGMNWQFDQLERVEFGTIRPYPEGVEAYVTSGRGSTTDVAPEDVRSFKADATFHTTGDLGSQAARSGEPQKWTWYLERDDSGRWYVVDWGY